MKHSAIFALLAIAVSCFTPIASQAQFDGDTRIWQELMIREHKGEKWTAYTWAELRYFNDASDLNLWFVQQKFYYKLRPNLSVGTGPAWIEVKKSTGWNTLARWEFELVPTWKFDDGSSLQFRNRLETRWWESRDYDTEFVSRHRLRYSKPADWLPRMKRFEMSNEIFIDYRKGEFNENRFRLYDLHFSAFDKSTVNTFFQVRSRKPGDDWQHAYIFGFGFRFMP